MRCGAPVCARPGRLRAEPLLRRGSLPPAVVQGRSPFAVRGRCGLWATLLQVPAVCRGACVHHGHGLLVRILPQPHLHGGCVPHAVWWPRPLRGEKVPARPALCGRLGLCTGCYVPERAVCVQVVRGESCRARRHGCVRLRRRVLRWVWSQPRLQGLRGLRCRAHLRRPLPPVRSRTLFGWEVVPERGLR